MTIEVTVVVGRKLRIPFKFSGKHSASKRHSREDPNFLHFRAREEDFSRALTETVENNLDGLNVGILDRLECLLDFLDAHAVVANLSGLNQIVENSEYLCMIIEFGWRAMQLQKIERIGRKIPQAIFDPCREVLPAVTFDGLLRQLPASLCRNDYFVLPLLFELRNQ